MKFAVTQCFKAYILNYAVCTAIPLGEHNQVTGLAADFKKCFSTLVYLIAEQDVLSEQALNIKIHLACFLLSTNEVFNKQSGNK